MKKLFVVIYTIIPALSFSQSSSEYQQIIAKADSLYNYKDYISAKYFYEKALALKPDEKYFIAKLEVCNLYFGKWEERLQYCNIDSIIPAIGIHLVREKPDPKLIPDGFVRLYNNDGQFTFCGYFFDGKFLHGFKYHYDSIMQFGKLPFVTKIEKFSNGQLTDSCSALPVADTVVVQQIYDWYGKLWKQINSPYQPNPRYYILKTYQKDFISQTYRYDYNCVGLVDTISYHYWETYKYDSLGRLIETGKFNGSGDSIKITYTYDDKNNMKTKKVVEYGGTVMCIYSYKYLLNEKGIFEEKLTDIKCPSKK